MFLIHTHTHLTYMRTKASNRGVKAAENHDVNVYFLISYLIDAFMILELDY